MEERGAVFKHRQLTKRKPRFHRTNSLRKNFHFMKKFTFFMKQNEKIFIDFHKIFISPQIQEFTSPKIVIKFHNF